MLKQTMASKVKLKFSNKASPPAKDKILEMAYGRLNVHFVRLHETGDGYKTIRRNTMDLDIVLSQKSASEFQKIGITVVTPPEAKAQHSVFVCRLDWEFGKHTQEQVKYDIEDKN